MAGNYRHIISEREKKLVISVSFRDIKGEDVKFQVASESNNVLFDNPACVNVAVELN